MIYTFRYRSQLFGDYVTVDVVHNGHNPTELYQYVFKELFDTPDTITVVNNSNTDLDSSDDADDSDELIPF